MLLKHYHIMVDCNWSNIYLDGIIKFYYKKTINRNILHLCIFLENWKQN